MTNNPLLTSALAYAGRGGVYGIRCLPNGKVYIGQTNFLRVRKAAHFRLLRLNRHWNAHLQSAFNQHGEQAFEFLVIERVGIVEIDSREQHWIKTFSSDQREHGYNIQAGGHKNKRLSPETRAKIGLAHKGKRHSIEHCARISAAKVGHSVSSETRTKLSLALRGRIVPQEQRRKIIANHSHRKPSKEQIETLRLLNTGKKHSPESILKMSIAHSNISKETRDKLSESHKGKHPSAQTRIKMSIAAKRRFSS